MPYWSGNSWMGLLHSLLALLNTYCTEHIFLGESSWNKQDHFSSSRSGQSLVPRGKSVTLIQSVVGRGGRDSAYSVSLRGVNFGFWSHLGCCRTPHSWKLVCFPQVFAGDNVPGQLSSICHETGRKLTWHVFIISFFAFLILDYYVRSKADCVLRSTSREWQSQIRFLPRYQVWLMRCPLIISFLLLWYCVKKLSTAIRAH